MTADRISDDDITSRSERAIHNQHVAEH